METDKRNDVPEEEVAAEVIKTAVGGLSTRPMSSLTSSPVGGRKQSALNHTQISRFQRRNHCD